MPAGCTGARILEAGRSYSVLFQDSPHRQATISPFHDFDSQDYMNCFAPLSNITSNSRPTVGAAGPIQKGLCGAVFKLKFEILSHPSQTAGSLWAGSLAKDFKESVDLLAISRANFPVCGVPRRHAECGKSCTRFVCGDMLGDRAGAGYLAAVSPDAVVYGSGESMAVLTRVSRLPPICLNL